MNPPLLLLFIASTFAWPAFAQLRVWTVSDTRHVLRGDPPGTNLAVQLGAARNEWVNFQLFARSERAVPQLNVEAGDLAGPAARIAPAQIQLYRQHQLRLETGTYRNTNFHADWYPDPLIPFVHPVAGKKLSPNARIKAVPFDLPAGEAHGFWVDIHVPSNCPPGIYDGAFKVSGQGQVVPVPVRLEVWNFALPSTPALVTALGSPAQRMRGSARRQAGAGNVDWNSVEQQCAEMLSEHHVNATPPGEALRPAVQPDGTFLIPDGQVQALRDFIDRYHVNAIQGPHPSSIIKDPQTEGAKLHRWLAAFDRMARELDRSNVVFFTYLKDEPNTREDYAYVQKWGRAMKEAHSALKVMVVEQPWTEPGKGGADSAWGDLFGAVDIWCPLFSLHRGESAAKRRAVGEMVWTYTALCQGKPTPWWHIDFPLLNYRAPAWMAWRDDLQGLLYWGGMAYWSQTDDPWTAAPIYTGSGKPQQGEKGIVFNGEGSLVYPARAVGYDGIVSTIRLKALRNGIQDYEYLSILAKAGRRADAMRISRGVTTSFFEWTNDLREWEKARVELARAIESTAGPR